MNVSGHGQTLPDVKLSFRRGLVRLRDSKKLAKLLFYIQVFYMKIRVTPKVTPCRRQSRIPCWRENGGGGE